MQTKLGCGRFTAALRPNPVGASKPKRTFRLGWRGTAIHDGRLAPRTSKKRPMKLTIKDHPTGGPRVEFEEDGRDIFVVVNGVTIARHTYPDTSAAGTWVSLEPGWTVTSSEDLSRIEIMYDGKQVSFDGKQVSFHLKSGCAVR